MSTVTPPAPPNSERAWWDTGREPSGQVVALACAMALSSAVVDLLLTSRISLFFDLCFVGTCVFAAWRIRPFEFFTVGVLPPLLMMGVLVTVALHDRGAIARPDDALVQAVVTGLANHAMALAGGYFGALGLLAARARGLSTQP